MEIYKFLDQEFKIIISRKLSKLQENTDNSCQEKNTWKIWEFQHMDRNHKKNQTEIMELKNTWMKQNNAIKSVNSRSDQAEERIWELKDMLLEVTQLEEQK